MPKMGVESSDDATGLRGVRSVICLDSVLFVLPFMLPLVLVGPPLLLRCTIAIYTHVCTSIRLFGQHRNGWVWNHKYCLGTQIAWHTEMSTL